MAAQLLCGTAAPRPCWPGSIILNRHDIHNVLVGSGGAGICCKPQRCKELRWSGRISDATEVALPGKPLGAEGGLTDLGLSRCALPSVHAQEHAEPARVLSRPAPVRALVPGQYGLL